MLWSLWAFGHAVAFGLISQMNRYWQLPGKILVRWRVLVPACLTLPLTFFFPPPTDPVFYIVTAISAMMVLLHDGRMYDITARYGANVALRMRPLVLPIVFVVWLILKPDQREALLAHPWLSAGLVACMALTTFFMMQLGKCTISRAAFRDMLPVIGTGVLFEIMNKTAMDHGSYPSNTIYYIYLTTVAPLLFSFLFATPKRNRKLLRKMAAIAPQGIMMGVAYGALTASKNIAMIGAPNPAYVTAVILTAPFWASLLMKLRGEKEEADWVSGTGMVVTIIAMAVLAANIPH